MNCEKLSFSQKLSDQRISQAEALLGRKIVEKILAYALFLLGVNRSAISSFLNMPPGSIRSLVHAMKHRGLAGFEDQRTKASSFKPPLPEQITPTLKADDSWLKVDFNIGNLLLRISDSNPVQKSVVLLSLVNSGILGRSEVADALRLSVDRTGKLARKLEQEDVKGILDQRQGQRQDYRFTPEIKAELIQQFVIEAVAQHPTGGEQMAKKLKERCQLNLSARSILSHLSKLGLPSIRDSLPKHLAELKKILKLLKKEANTKALELATDSTCQSPWTSLVFRLQLWVLLQHKIPETTISSVLGCHVKTVFIWKNRFHAGDGILDKPRSGRPPTIPPEVNHRLLAFYCQHDPLPGCTRWTIRWAEIYLRKHPDILQCPISRSSIHRLLKVNALKPYRNKYFLQICDPDFFPKMEKIIKVYKSRYKYLFCLDECTGLQALERKAPRLPAQGNHPEYLEPEYVRHGTVSILSILQVSTGQVFTGCIPDHTSSTLIASVKNHALQYDRSAELHYICDNYSSHSTEEFCLGIAELCGVHLPKLKTAHDRRQWLQSPEKRIIFHFLPTHGSWLNLIEIWFGILQQKALKDESFLSTTDLKNRIIAYTGTWNTDFAHPFNFSYTGEGLHEKVISRFTKWLQMQSPQMNVKFLGKQLKLMLNLATAYWPKAKKKAWNTLNATLQEKDDFIKGIIGADENLSVQLISLNNLLHTKLNAA